ncbi:MULTISPECIES: patatin-like phospholipase family protein [Kocuria]|uniref:patatin-like phospholipase family protein n=1 Tax=Kocuria TaxID=57493 RepID=UPI000F5417F1|nr:MULTISPECIES: patatin-like phospholipase family protein [Kocuria]MCT1546496.1 patatin-like phospholipase family protein [Kocuria rhizophila]MCT1916824.1 patatin-like phospholipase family protein [Kocuria rhizophila]MCT2172644.1 patatin-like phospholipase family protein [Kocuria rhizophila]MDN3463179.1 patatin-like phospholipase family protein [Kocuria sp. APC 4018]WSQ04487.1 patatin-like phospholipase family protein [Kocuria rhizophila]
MNTTTSPSRAIVLGGGGSAGIAWESGLLAGLLEAGADLEAADLVVGTSAGSAVAVQLRAGGLRLDALRAEMGHEADDGQSAPDDAAPAFDAEQFMQLMGEAAQGATTPEAGRARIGARAASASPALTEEAWLARIGGMLPAQWPAGRLALTAVDAGSGEFVVFHADSGVPLERAVAASCAVPMVFPLVHVGDRALMDGGMRSATNADLAAGYGRVLVVSCNPEPPTSPFGPTLDESLRLIGETGTALHVTADEASHRAFGTNPLDPARRIPSFEAGLAQARQLADRVTEFWNA